jgi:geranylgeranyl diphosphate synthase, type I
MQVNQFLQNYRQKSKVYTDRLFQNQLKKADKIGQVPYDIIVKLYNFHPRGKMHRGALSVLNYELGRGKREQEAIKASLVVEIFASSILIADDIIDQDEMRRGQKTIHRQWQNYFPNIDSVHYGYSMAIITHIIGLYLAPLILKKVKLDPLIKEEALNFFLQSNIETCYGEALDVSTPFFSLAQKKQSAQNIHDYKTVNYSAVMPLMFGAILSQNKDQVFLKNLRLYGECLGRIFQIQDDILGSFGDTKKTGKANTSDIKDARWTILVEILYKLADAKDKNILMRIFEKTQRSENDIAKVKDLMVKYKIVSKAQKKAQTFLDKGLMLIPKITKNIDHQDTLKNLLEFMIKREK